LEKLRSLKTAHVGLRLLLKNLNMRPEFLNEHDIAFKIAPRLNAFGRLSAATQGLKLLLTKDESRARELLKEMEKVNELRKKLTKEATEEVLRNFNKKPSKALIYKFKNIKKGIIGIVAGRVTASLGVPSIIFSPSGKNKVVGSARSPEGINIVKILEKLSNLLERWGGHSQAAGLTLKEDNLEIFEELFRKELENYSIKKPVLEIDLILEPKDLTPNRLREIKKLAPYGAGNRPPMFLFTDTLRGIKKTRYGFKLSFEKQKSEFYLNVNSEREEIPHGWIGRKVQVVYKLDNPDRFEISIEDLKPN